MKPDRERPTLRRLLAARRNSFRHAFAGLGFVLRTQPNARIHAAATVAAVLVGLWVKLARTEWALIVVVIAAVWAAEILNTAIEAAVDLACPTPHPLARTAKDCAAAAVLVTAVMAAAVGVLVLGPGLWNRLGF